MKRTETQNSKSDSHDEHSRLFALGWPDEAVRFIQLFASVEGELKQRGDTKRGRRLAEADWRSFSNLLGADFFEFVRSSLKAQTLISEPPRRRMNEGLKWMPEHPAPIENVEDLFVRGVCAVRNNLAHGEKFRITGLGWGRDAALVNEALWTLAEAIERTKIF